MAEGKSFFIDTTKCTACRGCQMACKQWNQRSTEKTINGETIKTLQIYPITHGSCFDLVRSLGKR